MFKTIELNVIIMLITTRIHYIIIRRNDDGSEVRCVVSMKELGIEKWLRAQIEQYTCPDCGELIWWERDTCQVCGHRLEVK